MATVLIVCGSAGGARPAPEQARQERDDWVERQARIDAQVIMVAMDAARIRAALLIRMGR